MKRKEEIAKGISSDISTALVVQGGGMRGVYSMAALMALEELGLSKSFDNIYAASAGAINAAYMLADQSADAVTVYVDDISNKNFVDMLRVKKIVDIDFLVDVALSKLKPLNVSSVIESKSILHIALTDFETGKRVFVTNHEVGKELMEAIRATAALPILYNKPVTVLGRKYVDGGVTNGIPLISALESGCTDVVVVLTRPSSFRRNRISNLMRLIEYPFVRNYSPGLRHAFFEIHESFNENLDLISNPSKLPKKINYLFVYPNEDEQVISRTTTKRETIIEGAYYGFRDTYQMFNYAPPSKAVFTEKLYR